MDTQLLYDNLLVINWLWGDSLVIVIVELWGSKFVTTLTSIIQVGTTNAR